jgi:putative DNA primase/helicase
MENPIHQFSEAARQAGLTINNAIIADGKLHRCMIEGDQRGKRNGWYVLHLDGSPAGVFGSWKTGESHTWSAQPNHELTSSEREEHRRRIELAKSQRQQTETKLREEAAVKAAKLWERAGTVISKHPYLIDKKIHPVGVKQLKKMLVVPVRDADGVLHSLQFIGTDGTKRFLTGGRKRSCFTMLGDNASETIYIAEGWATGCTICEATESTVIVAFDSGNLRSVAEALHKKYQDTRLIICADDDHKTPGNPGISKATEAALAVGGLLAVPSFVNDRPANATDFNDLYQHAGLDAVCQCLANAAEVPKGKIGANKKTQSESNLTDAPAAQLENWPPLLLPGTVRTPDIDADILPDWAGAMVAAVAKDTQTPESASVLLGLSVIATCVQGRFEVAPFADSSYQEPLCLWTLAALASGARKTPVLKALSNPLRQWEKLLSDRLSSEITAADAARRVAKRRIDVLEGKASKTDNAEERDNKREEIKQELENMPDELKAPRLMTADVTPERLQELMVEQRETMALISDEAGIFLVLGGMYSGGTANLDVFLQSYSGSPVMVDRKSRQAYMKRPALTFGLMVQPGVLQDVANDKRFHDSGLLARFLFAIPVNNVGQRNIRERNPVSESVSTAWRDQLHDLLFDAEKRSIEPHVLPFCKEALEAWLEFSQQVEDQLGPRGKLAHMVEWASKLPGQCARIAGLIQLIVTGRQSSRVELNAVQRAIRLCRLLVQHAKAAFRLLGADEVESDAFYLLQWITAHELHEFDRSYAQKSLEGKFRSVDKLKQAAARLAEWNVLTPELKRKNNFVRGIRLITE